MESRRLGDVVAASVATNNGHVRPVPAVRRILPLRLVAAGTVMGVVVLAARPIADPPVPSTVVRSVERATEKPAALPTLTHPRRAAKRVRVMTAPVARAPKPSPVQAARPPADPPLRLAFFQAP